MIMRKVFCMMLVAFAALIAKAQNLETITVAGKSRTMMVYQPQELPQHGPSVISLHGANQDAAYQRDQTKWNNCADTAKFVVVYPNAINKFWDTSGTSDIVFIETIIDLMYQRFGINLSRVYVSGFSLGAMMTYHCMEHLGNKVAAFGPVSGVRFDNRAPIAPRRVPFIYTHGTGDDVFKWTGDPGHSAGGYPYIPDYVQKWATYEKLDVKTLTAPYPSTKPSSIATLTKWTSSDPNDDVEIALLALKDKGHWHSEDIASGVSTTQEIWRFVKRYALAPVAPALSKVVPEDESFDLPQTERTFQFTFDDNVAVQDVKATLSTDGYSAALTLQETEASSTLTFTLPDSETLKDGRYTLTVTGVKHPEGGKAVSHSVRYEYGYKEVGDEPDTTFADKYKGEFKRLLKKAALLLEQTKDVEQLTIKNARNRLQQYIDNYSTLASTSPSAYTKKMPNLQRDIEILEKYIASGIDNATQDFTPHPTTLYNVSGQQVGEDYKGVVIMRQGTQSRKVMNK